MDDLKITGSDFCEVCGMPRIRSMEVLGTIQTFRVRCNCESAERDAYVAKMKAEERRQEIERNRSTGFSERRLREYTFKADDGGNPKLMTMCRNYAENFADFRRDGKGLLIYGTVGNGKTFMAAAIANKLIDDGYRVLMTSMTRIVNQIWSDQNKNEYLDSLKNYDLLIIDDFGVERETDFMSEKVFEIIDARYRQELPLIVTSNLTDEELRTPGDLKKQRVYSRIFEMCLPFKVSGADRRKAAIGKEASYYMNMLKGEK